MPLLVSYMLLQCGSAHGMRSLLFMFDRKVKIVVARSLVQGQEIKA